MTANPINERLDVAICNNPLQVHLHEQRYRLALEEVSPHDDLLEIGIELGATYKERGIAGPNAHINPKRRLIATSFNGSKIVTPGGGGALFSHDKVTAKHAKHLSTTAKADAIEFYSSSFLCPRIRTAIRRMSGRPRPEPPYHFARLSGRTLPLPSLHPSLEDAIQSHECRS